MGMVGATEWGAGVLYLFFLIENERWLRWSVSQSVSQFNRLDPDATPYV